MSEEERKDLEQRILSEYREPPTTFVRCVLAVVVTLFALFLVCILTGCNTSKSVTDKSTINKADSVHTEYITIHDTVKIVETVYIKDSTSTESNKQTQITFSDKGGNFNLKTGEATGVLSVEMTDAEKSLQTTLTDIEKVAMSYCQKNQILTDSIATLNKQMDLRETEEVKSNWYWWMIIGCIIGVALIIFLKKFPYTRPLMFWL